MPRILISGRLFRKKKINYLFNIVPKALNNKNLEKMITKDIETIVGTEMIVDVNIVKNIEKTRFGKKPLVISRVASEQEN